MKRIFLLIAFVFSRLGTKRIFRLVFPKELLLPHRDREEKSLMIGANKGEFLLIWSHLSLAIRLNQGEMERTFYSASFFAEEKRLVVLALKVLLSHFYGALKKADELQCSKLQILCSADWEVPVMLDTSFSRVQTFFVIKQFWQKCQDFLIDMNGCRIFQKYVS